MELAQTWYLMKNDDDSTFGPISFEQLRQWSLEAQISPLDKVSNDQKNWIKAPMVPELEMDYLIEVTPDQFYGPTTLGAVREFLQAGEINSETPVTNCRDGSMKLVSEMPGLQLRDEEEPVRTSIRVNLQQRVRDLETALMEERRAREQAEHLVEKLEAKIAGITRAAAL
jgi:peptidoglycan hydrolase-like protein with peptidoglycan-binding domain